MHTFAAPRICRHAGIRITTEAPTGFVDLTEQVVSLVTRAGIDTGIVHVQSLHTTAAIVVNEHEPLLLTDFVAFLDRVASRAGTYQHDDDSIRTVNLGMDERPNGHAHCQALVLGTSVCLNVVGGRLNLGTWQRLFLVELDGARRREISILAIGSFDRSRR